MDFEIKTESESPKPNQRQKKKGADANKELTILMVGETGVGKSTFINAFVNYLLYENLADAAEHLKCIIPTSFSMYDDSTFDMKECTIGDFDENECNDKTESSTQTCRCYNFQIGDVTLKIIDTPGIADCRGVERDQLNLKHLLNFLSNYKELNAICILLKPNNAKVSIVFKYCILELLTHLNKSASDNILFLFTNSRGTFYKPGDTAKALRKVLQDIRSRPPYVEIKFNQENYFCFDSEAFRYLVAISEPNNIVFDGSAHDDFEKSWQRSVSECQRLFKRISDIVPHPVQDTISINNVRTKIMNLRKPIALIAENIGNEITACQRHEKTIKDFKGDIKELEKELYIPALDIISEPLDQPITVCSDPECCEKKACGNSTKVHYKSICHKPCYLEKSDGSIIGNSGLLNCQSFNKYTQVGVGRWTDPKYLHPDQSKISCNEEGLVIGIPTERVKSEICFNCSHSYQVHLTINYETKIETKQIRDENKFTLIEANKQTIDRKLLQIDKIKAKVEELKEERRFITGCSAHFARFLMHNAITPFNDALEDYIKCCIANEEKGNRDAEVIQGLKDMLEAYDGEKKTIEKLSQETFGESDLTCDQIDGKIQEVFELKHYGTVIKQHMDLEAQGQLNIKVALEKEVQIGTKETSVLSAVFCQIFSKFKYWWKH